MTGARPADDVLAREVGAYLHLRRVWHDKPVRYAQQRLGMNPTWQQRKILHALEPEGAKVSVRSGHGIGKTGAVAAAIWWFLETRQFSKVPCTAPTGHQLRDVLWAEVSKRLREADAYSKARGDHSRLWLSSLFGISRERIWDYGNPAEWYAVARTSGRDNPDALQGFHASDLHVSDDGKTLVSTGDDVGHILFVVEEASGVFEGVFEVAEGALSSPGARLLMVGNPTKINGYFADSHRRNRSHFTPLHFRSSQSPLAADDYRHRLVRKYGENSNVVRVRADGEFPTQEDTALISLEVCEAALARAQYIETVPVRIGVDVAEFGSDRTVLTARRGRNILHAEVHGKQETMATAGQARNLRKQFNASGIYVDANGLGAGVASRLRELGEPVVGVIVSRRAPNRASNEDAQGKLLRDWLYMQIADWLSDEDPAFCGDADLMQDLAGELASIHYDTDSDGRIVVEPKKAMRKRLGGSPDIAESLAMTFDPTVPGQSGIATVGTRTF